MNKEIKKIVLAYLIKNGVQYHVSSHLDGWNYFSGGFECVAEPLSFSPAEVDIEKTPIPSYDTRYEFVGTGCDAAGIDVIYTEVVLKNGVKVNIGLVKPHELILDLLENIEPPDFKKESEEFWGE